jgi:integrase
MTCATRTQRYSSRLASTSKPYPRRRGHSSVAITADLYSHVRPAMLQAAADKLDALLERHA